MRMRSRRTQHLARLLLSVLAGGAPAAALTQPAPQPPLSSIRVTGDARVTAKPDRVQIDIGVTTRAAQSQDAASQNAHDTDSVLAAVRKAAGPAASLRTISYSLSPNYRYHPKEGEPTIEGYTAVNVVQVTLDDLTRVLTVEESSPRIMPVRVFNGAARAASAEAAPTPVEAGTLDITADVTLSVEVGPAPR